MRYLKLFVGIIPIIMIGCGGGDDNSTSTTTNNTTKTDNTSDTNEWRLVKQESDESKDGSVDSTIIFFYDANSRFERLQIESIVEDVQARAIASINYNAEGQWIRSDWDSSGIGIEDGIEDDDFDYQVVETYSYGIDGKVTEGQLDFYDDGLIDEITNFFYNSAGKLEREDSFDDSGYLEETITFIYDASGRMTKTVVDTGGDGIIDDETIYTYDFDGNLSKAEDNDSITYYTWEAGKFSIGKGFPMEWFLSAD